MTTTETAAEHLSQSDVYALAKDEGTHLEFLNVLATIKASAANGGSMTAVEFDQPRGFGPPLHCHRDEDEIFVLLDGTVTLKSGDREIEAEAGGFVFLPHGVPHTFQVTSETARMLSITASASGTPVFDQMVSELGVPSAHPVIPEPRDIDPGHVAMVNDKYGIDILGPPPAPLTD
jgi:mannose-6-phosphate isomerase-like protein (cupin superfamily)